MVQQLYRTREQWDTEGEDVPIREFRASGAAAQLFRCRDREVLMEGPAGTGKTRAVLELANYLCETYRGIRVLMCRKTRTSMTESVLVTWEQHVLWEGHPAIVGDARRNNRQYYQYPNGSHVVIGGLDNPERIMSTEYDLICVFEATECTLEDWERLLTRLRNNRMPWQQAIADCNPGSRYHWLNVRATGGKMTRLLSRHRDNPSVTPEYLATLDRLTGARRERLLLGHWVSEEGLVYEYWDPTRHVIPEAPVDKIRWTFATVDWGYRNPGVFQVWGADADTNLYRLAEVYYTQQQLDWWADVACDLDSEFDLHTIRCDPSEPGNIEKLNDRIGGVRGRPLVRIADKADNDVRPGIDQVVWGLAQPDEAPRMYFVADAQRRGKDPTLVEALQPTCTEEEFPGLVWRQVPDNAKQKPKEEPDPTCPDHGLDCARYAALFAWRKDLNPPKPEEKYKPWTMGDVMRHAEVWGDDDAA